MHQMSVVPYSHSSGLLVGHFSSPESANKGNSKLISSEFQNAFEMDVYD